MTSALLVLGGAAAALMATRLTRSLHSLAALAGRDEDANTADVQYAPGRSVVEIDAAAQALLAARDAELRRREVEVALRVAHEQRAAAAASEQRLRRVVDSVFIYIGLLDAKGCVVEANRAPLEGAALAREAVVELPFWLTPWWKSGSSDAAAVQDAVQRALQGETARCDVHAQMAAGATPLLDFQAAALRGDDGQITNVVVSAVDITERVAAAAAAQAERRRLDALLDATPADIIVTDAAGHLLRMNRSDGVWGRVPVQARAQDATSWKGWWADGSPRQGQPLLPQEWPLARALRQRETVIGDIVEIEPFGMPGVRRVIHMSAAPTLDERGRVTGGVVAQIEITDRVAAEQALREADRQKDEFLATLAHELRSPLAPIRAGADLIRLRRSDDPSVARAGAVIVRQCDHLKRLVDELLDVSRITLGTIHLALQPMDLRQAIDAAVESVLPLVEKARQKLRVDVPPQPVVVQGDMTRLAQVVFNLLNNSTKFTPQGGDISVVLGQEGDEAVVRVRDDGCGIEPEMLGKIFGMFVQEQRSGHGGSSGLGIGLALVQRLLKSHGGSITASSEGRGRGCEFVLRLPMSAAAALPQPATAAPTVLPTDATMQAGARSLDVLVCDDNTDAANLLAELLRMHGHGTRVAHDGEAAEREATTKMSDVAVLDIGLPDIDGCEVARRVRALPGRQPLLVALTGWGQQADRQRALDAGFDHHLTKPADIDTVLTLLLPRQAAETA